MSHRELLETWFRRVWHEKDSTAIEELMREGTPVQGLGSHVHSGPEDFEAFAQAILALAKDVRITIDRSIEDGDWISALVTVQATANSDGRTVRFPGQVFLRYSGDKIAEAYNSFDFISMFEQIGQLPEETFEACLSGERIG